LESFEIVGGGKQTRRSDVLYTAVLEGVS